MEFSAFCQKFPLIPHSMGFIKIPTKIKFKLNNANKTVDECMSCV